MTTGGETMAWAGLAAGLVLAFGAVAGMARLAGLPIQYNLRNVVVRWRSSVATVLGIAAVVAVFVALRAMARGIEASSASTGDPSNLLVVRKGSQAESGSLVTREQFRIIESFGGIQRNAEGRPVVSAEVVAIISAARVVSQNVAYEIPMLLVAITMIMITGTMDLNEIVRQIGRAHV